MRPQTLVAEDAATPQGFGAKDAIEGYLEVLADEGRPLPRPVLIEHITVAA